MEFVIYTVKNRGGNPGNWHAFSGPTVETYANQVSGGKHYCSDQIKNGKL